MHRQLFIVSQYALLLLVRRKSFFLGNGQTFIRIVNVCVLPIERMSIFHFFIKAKHIKGYSRTKKPAFLTDNIINNTVEQYAIFITYLESLGIHEINVLLTRFFFS